MITETTIRTVTTDTAEPVTVPVLPADDRTGGGYDWMNALEGTVWSVLPNWGSEGWDAGSWPTSSLPSPAGIGPWGDTTAMGSYRRPFGPKTPRAWLGSLRLYPDAPERAAGSAGRTETRSNNWNSLFRG